MDKVINYSENSESDVESNNGELSDYELDDEERSYYLSLTKKIQDYDDYDFTDKNKSTKTKKVKKQKNKVLLDLNEPKKWKSKRTLKKKKDDGVYIEQRKFNPRALPLNFVDNILKERNKAENKIVKIDFPSLGKETNTNKVQGAWGKKLDL